MLILKKLTQQVCEFETSLIYMVRLIKKKKEIQKLEPVSVVVH